MKKCAGSS